jgi:16S rRNA processing protein RimM
VSYTDPPESLLEHGEWTLRDARGDRARRRVAEAETRGGQSFARLEGVEDRTAAQALQGWVIEVPRSALPPPGPKEYYRADLIGFEVRNLEGEVLGQLGHFVDAPAGPVMVVPGENEHWIPATPERLRSVDLEARRVIVDWPTQLD